MAKSKRELHKEEVSTNIAGRLQAIRKHYGFSCEKMAGLMGISEITYRKNEIGRHIPTALSLMALHNRLGISIEWVLLGKEPMSWKEDQEQRRLAEEKRAAEEQERKEQQEREKRQEAERLKWQETQAGKDVFSQEVAEMIETMKRVPLLRHSVMGYYQKFLLKNKELIAASLQPNEMNQPPQEPPPSS